MCVCVFSAYVCVHVHVCMCALCVCVVYTHILEAIGRLLDVMELSNGFVACLHHTTTCESIRV